MGGGQRLYMLVGAGAGGGTSFWVDRIAPSKKMKPSRSGKIKNIGAVNM